MDEDEDARRRRAERLREEIEAAGRDVRTPRTPRDFTERAAREAEEEARTTAEPGGDEPPAEERSDDA
jgi:hypothetical protein